MAGFAMFVQSAELHYSYPCPGGECAETDCRCSTDDLLCDFANLLDVNGQRGEACSPAALASADIYVYGNQAIQSIALDSAITTFGRFMSGLPGEPTLDGDA